MSKFEQILGSKPEDLLLPNKELHQNTLAQIKSVLDPIAKDYSIFDAVHVDGLDAEQVWAQAQMIVDGAVDKLFTKLSDLAGQAESEAESGQESGLDSEEDLETDSAEEQSEDEMQQLHQGEEDNEFASFDEEHDDFQADDMDDFAEGENSHVVDEEEVEEEADDDDELIDEEDRTGLNTGLFNLQDFQQQVLAMEQEDDDEDDENVDYFNQVPESDNEGGDDRYEDFFAPPRKKQKITKKDKQAFAEDEEVEEAFESTRKDLFDDEDMFSEGEADQENLSKFERQQLELQNQIDQLETENVGEKFWAAKGEVQAGQRPQDSLINTEIDFERNSKPAPVITQEVTDSLEDMIRERVKKQEFDDLSRRIQGIDHKPSRELAELSEQKSEKALGELYEDDEMRRQNPEYYQSKDNAQLEAAHKEIVDLYGSLSRKLDSLSSWHFTPKAPKPSLAIVSDVAAISMEEAQPTAMSTSSMLAPQEVYKPGSGEKSELVGRNNLPVARDEMSTEDKHKARRKAKSKKAKELAKKEEVRNAQSKSQPKKKDTKDQMFETLKKGNVNIIDKRGQKRDLRGNLVKDGNNASASHMKL